MLPNVNELFCYKLICKIEKNKIELENDVSCACLSVEAYSDPVNTSRPLIIILHCYRNLSDLVNIIYFPFVKFVKGAL